MKEQSSFNFLSGFATQMLRKDWPLRGEGVRVMGKSPYGLEGHQGQQKIAIWGLDWKFGLAGSPAGRRFWEICQFAKQPNIQRKNCEICHLDETPAGAVATSRPIIAHWGAFVNR